MDEKICRICNESKPMLEFGSNGLGGKRTECKKCRNELKKQRYKENHEHELEYHSEYRETHKNEIKKIKDKYRTTHPDKVKHTAHTTYMNRRDRILMDQHVKYANNIDGYADKKKQQMRTLRSNGYYTLKDRKKRSNQRGLGFEAINDYFHGRVFHHLTKRYGIFIPNELHKSVWHSHVKNIGIVEINNSALKWYKDQIDTEEF